MSDISEMLARLFEDLPQEYERRAAAMAEIDQSFHRAMATQMQTALKEAMKQKPHATYEEKKEFTKWVNGELRRYGLAILAKVSEVDNLGKPKESSYPAILKADPGHHPDEGRFRIFCKSPDGKVITPLVTPNLSVLLDAFFVIADDPDRRRWGKWTNQVDARGSLGRG